MPAYLKGSAAGSSHVAVDWCAEKPCPANAHSKGPRLRLLHEANIERKISQKPFHDAGDHTDGVAVHGLQLTQGGHAAVVKRHLGHSIHAVVARKGG